jgi:hypothetical protein
LQKNRTLRSQNGGSLPGVFFTFGAMAIAGFPSRLTIARRLSF